MNRFMNIIAIFGLIIAFLSLIGVYDSEMIGSWSILVNFIGGFGIGRSACAVFYFLED